MSPLIRNISLGIGGTVVAVAVYFGAVTAGNYQGTIFTHLVDIVNGNTTKTAVVLNSPAWSFAEPQFTPAIGTIATSSYGSAASGLASSTTYYFAVAALDVSGTTTLSSTLTITTDASNTQPTPEAINLTWTPVIGASGYAIYFSTSTNALNQYFYATTSGAYFFATSTGSFPGSNTQVDTTAFSTWFNPIGPDYINGGNGTATTSNVSSTTAFQVNGAFAAISQGSTTVSCLPSNNGQMFYSLSNGHLWLCQGAGPAWTLIK
jgi:hypothetical protein